MVAFEFDPLYHSILILVSSLLPGIALGVPLLRKSELSLLEKLALCFFLGMVSVPSLLFVESLAGLKFSFLLVLADIVALCAAGAFIGFRCNAFTASLPALPKFDLDSVLTEEFARKHAVSALLLLALFLAFWMRLQTFSPIYSELDPYYYVYGTGQIIRDGSITLYDDAGWWPEANSTHRVVPLKTYMEAQWYSAYTGGGEYDNYVLFVASSWLPPISAAFVAFGAYLLLSSYAGRRYGLFAAFLLVFTPIL